MIKAIVFDFGGVLFPIQPYISEPSRPQLRKIKQLVIDAHDHGKISYVNIKNKLLQLGRPDFSEEELDLIYRSISEINQPLLKQIIKLSEKFQIFGLVNEAPVWTDLRIESHNLEKYFTKVYVSSEIGLEKPDSGIFNYFLEETNLEADKCVFIDDSEKNCAAAKKLGFSVIQYEDFGKFQKQLENLLR